MKCAVVHGRQPLEIREQAALFNDPESGYDVMVVEFVRSLLLLLTKNS